MVFSARPPGRRFRATAVLLAVALVLSGCASWPRHGVTPGTEAVFPIAVLPVRVTAQASHLSDLTAVPAPAGVAEREQIDAELARAGEALTRSLTDRLDASPHLEPVDPGRVAEVMAATPEADPAALGRALGVSAVLQVTLSGYGKIKRRWLTWLIGSGVVEAVVQGVVAARVTKNNWIALGIGLEELASELLTWGGGAWLFNAHYAPVTLEARLVASRDGEVVWRNLVVVGIDRKALKRLPKEERKRREVQLRVTAERAARTLARHLEKSARRRLTKPAAARS